MYFEWILIYRYYISIQFLLLLTILDEVGTSTCKLQGCFYLIVPFQTRSPSKTAEDLKIRSKDY